MPPLTSKINRNAAKLDGAPIPCVVAKTACSSVLSIIWVLRPPIRLLLNSSLGGVRRRCNRAAVSTKHTTAINSIKQKAVSCQHRTYDSDAIKQKAVAGTSTEHTTAINLIKQNAVASTEHNGRGRLRPRPVGEYFGVDKDIQAGGRTEVRIHSLSITVKTPR